MEQRLRMQAGEFRLFTAAFPRSALVVNVRVDQAVGALSLSADSLRYGEANRTTHRGKSADRNGV